jgi:hypothetical protein
LRYALPAVLLVFLAAQLPGQQGMRLVPSPGFYAEPQRVEVLGAPIAIGAGAIFYTTDGRTPDRHSLPYTGGPIPVRASSTLRVVSYGADGKAEQFGGTYLIGEPPSELMTVAVAIDPWRLFHPESGWFVAGSDTTGARGANWWTDAEHPVHVEIFTPGGKSVHAGRMGFRLFGGRSRVHPQKSFSLSGRKRYGNRRIDYPLFGEGAGDRFQFVVLRNGGSDWGRSYLRDALLTGLLADPSWELDVQAARPVRVYLNGKYWGLYHLREKINPRFLADRYDVDKDSLSLIEHERTVKHGSDADYTELRDYVSRHDLADQRHYAWVEKRMDVDNFQRLQIAQTYFDNRDAGGNIRFWRPNGPNERFRWILYDVDQGFGLHRQQGWTTNSLTFFTEPAGPVWPNPPWSTLLQRKLLANPAYRRNFINRSLDYLHTDFSAEAVLERTDAAIEAIAEEMPRQQARWDRQLGHWRYHCDQLRRFALYRPDFLREHLREYFRAGSDRAVAVRAGRGGYVVVNDNLQVGSDGLEGRYFADVPIRLEAVALPGYRFAGWEGAEEERPIFDQDLGADRSYELEARFAPSRHPLADRIIINEVCPRSEVAGDWLELYHREGPAVNLEGWFLIDGSGERFHLPPTLLRPGSYLVVSREGERFAATYPEVPEFIAGLPFGLHKEVDRLGLYAADGSYVNSIRYELPPREDTVFTYALALPGLDNSRHRHWVAEAGPGTPGRANPAHLQSAIVTRQQFWVRVGVGFAVLLLIVFVRVFRN